MISQETLPETTWTPVFHLVVYVLVRAIELLYHGSSCSTYLSEFSLQPSSSVQISVKPGDKNKRGKDGKDFGFISVTAGAVAGGLFVIVVAILIVLVIRRRKNKRFVRVGKNF